MNSFYSEADTMDLLYSEADTMDLLYSEADSTDSLYSRNAYKGTPRETMSTMSHSGYYEGRVCDSESCLSDETSPSEGNYT